MSDDLDFGSTVRGFVPEQKVFGRYLLRKILGRGGMGVVWLAHDEELERDIAMKFLPEVVANDKQSIKDLKRETRRSLELTHPNIIRIYDFVQDGSGAGISMEFVAGDTLASLKVDQPNGHFEVSQLEPWLEQLCRALDYAHNKAKVVHRDLKPANLMIDDQGDLKIADFGIAASVSDSVSRVSNQAGSSGTPVYMSPQQMMGEDPAPVDDVYSLGATLFELLTSKPPFFSGNVMMQVMNKQPPTMAARRQQLELTGEEIPANWEEVIAACLSKEREDRPPSVADVLERLTGTRLGRAAKSSIRPSGQASTAASPPSQPSQPSQPTAQPTAPSQPVTPPPAPAPNPPVESAAGNEDAAPETAKPKTSAGVKILRTAAALVVFAVIGAFAVGYYINWAEDKRAAELARQQAEEERAREREAAWAETQAALGLSPATEETITAAADSTLASTGSAETTKPVVGEPWTVPGLDIEMMPIEPGSFVMGSPEYEEGRYEDERQTRVTVTDPYWVASTEVTVGQWEELMGHSLQELAEFALSDDALFDVDGDYLTLAERWEFDPSEDSVSDIARASGDDLPVHFVSWRQAMGFVYSLTERERAEGRLPEGYEYALPTEAQWERAARGGSATATYEGEFELLGVNHAPVLNEIAWYGGNSGEGYAGSGWGSGGWREKQFDHTVAGPRSVGSKQPNDWGLYDMLGNVSEWTFDRHADYPTGTLEDPIGAAEGLARVHRGGSWFSVARRVRAAYRDWDDKDYRDKDVGFRVALVPSSLVERQSTQERIALEGDEAIALARQEARAAVSFDERFTVPDLQLTMIEVQAGTFSMGSPTYETGRRGNEVQREVSISSNFWLGETEVTQGQWRAIMGGNPSAFPGLGDEAPMESVSYDDVTEFIARFNERESEAGRLPEGFRYDLPTEAQWEFAARAGTSTAYHWGDEPGPLANFENAPGSTEDGNVDAFGRVMELPMIASTHPVRTWEPNPWGFYDMHGNVWEWCRDTYAPYAGQTVTDPFRSAAGEPQVYRGGSWYHAARYSRSAARSYGDASSYFTYLGFRLALVKDE